MSGILIVHNGSDEKTKFPNRSVPAQLHQTLAKTCQELGLPADFVCHVSSGTKEDLDMLIDPPRLLILHMNNPPEEVLMLTSTPDRIGLPLLWVTGSPIEPYANVSNLSFTLTCPTRHLSFLDEVIRKWFLKNFSSKYFPIICQNTFEQNWEKIISFRQENSYARQALMMRCYELLKELKIEPEFELSLLLSKINVTSYPLDKFALSKLLTGWYLKVSKPAEELMTFFNPSYRKVIYGVLNDSRYFSRYSQNILLSSLEPAHSRRAAQNWKDALIQNIKFPPPGGCLRLLAETVADDGQLPEMDQQRLEKFLLHVYWEADFLNNHLNGPSLNNSARPLVQYIGNMRHQLLDHFLVKLGTGWEDSGLEPSHLSPLLSYSALIKSTQWIELQEQWKIIRQGLLAFFDSNISKDEWETSEVFQEVCTNALAKNGWLACIDHFCAHKKDLPPDAHTEDKFVISAQALLCALKDMSPNVSGKGRCFGDFFTYVGGGVS